MNSQSPAGPQFNQRYNGDFDFATHSARENIHMVPQRKSNAKAYYEENNKLYHQVIILDAPIDESQDP